MERAEVRLQSGKRNDFTRLAEKEEHPMAAPRANWKGYLVTCPAALYPALNQSAKIRFNNQPEDSKSSSATDCR